MRVENLEKVDFRGYDSQALAVEDELARGGLKEADAERTPSGFPLFVQSDLLLAAGMAAFFRRPYSRYFDKVTGGSV